GENLIRQKRVTCDLLSFQAGGFSFGNSACAAHCLQLGRKGGSCKDGVCVCR
ncbi:defensin 2, partial [Rhyzopertha dominica]